MGLLRHNPEEPRATRLVWFMTPERRAGRYLVSAFPAHRRTIAVLSGGRTTDHAQKDGFPAVPATQEPKQQAGSYPGTETEQGNPVGRQHRL